MPTEPLEAPSGIQLIRVILIDTAKASLVVSSDSNLLILNAQCSFSVFLSKAFLTDIGIYFSCVSTEELERRALKIMQEARMKPANPGYLVPDPGDAERKWGDKKPVNKKTLVNKIITTHLPYDHPKRDQQVLHEFLFACKKDRLCYPSSLKLTDIIPAGVPLLDFLSVDSKRIDAYKYPPTDEIKLFQNNRGLDRDSFTVKPDTVVPVMEIRVGECSDEEIMEVWDFYKEKMAEEKKIYPSGVVSLDVEEIKITNSDLSNLISNVGSETPIQTATSLLPGDKWCQFPVKILIGSGLRFMIVVSWPAQRSKPGGYKVRPVKPQDLLIEFLNSLPTAVGVGIKNDVPQLEKIFSSFNPGNPLKMAPWMDLVPLAALCGYRLQATNMAALSLVVLGGLMDKTSSRADGRWCLFWDEMPEEFKIYALGDCQFGHMTFVVLSSILLRDIFPDPDSFGVLTWKHQAMCVQLFCKWLVKSLVETEVSLHPGNLPKDRKELINCIKLRVQTSSTKSTLADSPRRVSMWADLLGDWPPLTEGGPRYLHQVRETAVAQASIIAPLELSDNLGLLNPFHDKNLHTPSYLRYDQPDISSCDHTAPIPDGRLGLHASPDLKKKLFDVVPQNMRIGDLIKQGKVQERAVRYGLYEFCRLNPDSLLQVYLRFEKSGDITKEFWNQHDSIFEDIRLMHIRLFNTFPKRIEWIESRIEKRLLDLEASEKAALKEAQRVLKRREQRYGAIKTAINLGPYIRRTGLANRLPSFKPTVSRSKVSLPVPRTKTTNIPFPQMKPLSVPRKRSAPATVVREEDLDPNHPSKPTAQNLLGDSGGETGEVRRVRYVDLDSEEQEVVEVSSGDNSEPEELPEMKDPLPLQRKRKAEDDKEHSIYLPAKKKTTASGMTIIIPSRRLKCIPAGAEGDPEIDPLYDEDPSTLDDPEKHPEWLDLLDEED